jgi:hypothetical protein
MSSSPLSRLWVVILLPIGLLVAQNSSDVRLDLFKERIAYHATNYQEVSANIHASVIFGIPDITKCPLLAGDFRVTDESIYLIEHGEGISKRIRYTNGKNTIDITFYYVPTSHRQMEGLFFKILSSVNSSEIPGQRGPLDLGDVSVELPNPYGYEILFLYNNIYTQIQSYDKSIDVISIARWIQSQFQTHPWSEVQNQMPRPAREIIGRTNIREGQALLSAKTLPWKGKVGEPIEVNVELPTGTDKSHYLIRVDYDHLRFRSVMVNNVLTVTPTKSGLGSFRYVLIDNRTLLFTTYEVPVDIQP